jgi:hypothetical protein
MLAPVIRNSLHGARELRGRVFKLLQTAHLGWDEFLIGRTEMSTGNSRFGNSDIIAFPHGTVRI